jgi:HK97 family phage portal protein
MKISNLFKRKKTNQIDLSKLFTNSSNTITGKDSTSFAAIDLICSSFASLSGSFYSKDTRQAIKDIPLYELLQNPNIDETKFDFFYNSAKDYFNGNCFLYKSIIDGEIVSLFRLNPSNVKVRRDPTTNQKIYSYNGQDYTSEQILHIPSRFSYNGLIGKSIFDECRSIFSNTSEIDNYVNQTFNNSIGNRLVIDISKEFPNASQEQISSLKDLFLQNYAGVNNAGKPLIKSGNLEYSTIATDSKDNRSNQLLENRQFQEKEVAKLFGVPLALLSGNETNNIESLYTIFIENAIRPLATSFEQAINKLLYLTDRNYIYFEYSYNSLLKVSLQTRIDTYSKEIMNGILTPNEVRHKENLAPIDERAGDTLYIPANLLPVRDNVIDAFLASAQLKMEELSEKENQHSIVGDDKE